MTVKTVNTKVQLLTKMIALTSALMVSHVHAVEFEASGKLAVEQRYFFKDAQFENQFNGGQTSLVAEPELYWSWNDGFDSIIFTPFYRVDSQDDNRQHGDIRELAYIHAADDWELRLGIRKEFWGVTEFQHLVDVINQTDGVEDFDGEDKLGQQMVNLSLVRDWGIVDVFLLPGFRERTFAGEEGRLRGPIVVDDDNVNYESSAGQQHLDVALRWVNSIGDYDIGAYWFHGTNREPILTPSHNGEKLVLQQYYNQMDQLGLDFQATLGDWLWKFETIYRKTSAESFVATQAGFEYSFIGIFDTSFDLGLLTEYAWDSRGEVDFNTLEFGKSGSVFQNDVFVGARLALNDMQSSELLMGIGTDLDHSASSFLVEASRRFGESFKASLDIRLLQSSDSIDTAFMLRHDDHAQLSVEWYF